MSSLIIPTRRGFLIGVGVLLAAPAIVRATSIMPISVLPPIERPRSRWYHLSISRGGPNDELSVFVDGEIISTEQIVRQDYNRKVMVRVAERGALSLRMPPIGSYQEMMMKGPA